MRRSMLKFKNVLAIILALILFASASVGVYAEGDSATLSGENSSVNALSQDSEDIANGESEQVDSVKESNEIGVPEGTEASESGDKSDASSQEQNEDEATVDDQEKKSDEDSKPELSADEKSEASEDEANADEKSEKDVAAAGDEEKDKDETDKTVVSHEDSHKLQYEDLKNGKHKVTCGEENCEGIDSYEEDCDFDENGKCKKCGYYDESKDKSKVKQHEKTLGPVECAGVSFTAYIPEGTFDTEDFTFEVSEVTGKADDVIASEISTLGNSIYDTQYKGFDISFKSGDTVLSPKDKIKITVNGLGFAPKNIIHFLSDNEGVEIPESDTGTNEDGSLYFWASSFSPFYFVTYELRAKDVPTDGVLYGGDEKNPYGFGGTKEKHLSNLYLKDEIGSDEYAVRVLSHNTNDSNYPVVAPYNVKGDKYFVYQSAEEGLTVHFTVEAPENYYVESVYLKGGSSIEKKDGAYEIPLQKFGSDKLVNEIVVCLKANEVSWAESAETTAISGATLVNYKDLESKSDKNYIRVFGDDFHFNHGDEKNSNYCNYRQVYQGLASSTYDGTFKLTNGFDGLFVDSAEYVKDYRSNVGVEFKKDTDGYWTLDSNSYRYEIVTEDDKNTLKAVDGEKSFRPFGNQNHFGMILPIVFGIESSGKNEDGSDTIFKFAGDDDVFVYIDGQLVLDLGGIHDAIKGQINFNSGEILIQGDYQSKLTSSVDDSCFRKKILGAKNLYEIVGTKSDFAKNEHKLTVVYFERGGHRSNCRISFNFNKTEEVDVDYEGFKRKEDNTPLEGAEFTLYKDSACTEVVKVGESDAITVSDANGTIRFTGLPAGIVKVGQTAERTYYMKETKAPTGYKTPAEAVWALKVKAQLEDGKIKTSNELSALTDQAKSLGIDTEDGSLAIKNEEKKPGYLNIIKVLKNFQKAFGAAVCVFEVNYTDLDGNEHSNVYSYDFNESGTQNSIKIKLPADVNVTVKEVYSGADYKLVDVSVPDGTVTIKEGETEEITFTNDYDGHTRFGTTSITNIFEKGANGIFSFLKKVFGGAQ